jgi:TolA-binding protein
MINIVVKNSINSIKEIKWQKGNKQIKPVISFSLFLILLLSALFFTGCLNPEPLCGSIEGYVYRETKEGVVPLSNVLISVSEVENTALTDSQGYYQLNGIEVGTHELTATKEGYVTKTVPDILVEENKTTEVEDIITYNSSEEDLFNQGKSFYVDGAYNDAITIFRELINTYSDSKYASESQFFLACSYYNLNYYNQAIEEYKEVLSNYPDSDYADDAQYFIAYSYEKKLSFYSKALLNYYALINDYPVSPWLDEARFGMGNCYFANSEYNNAIDEYQKLIDHYPDSPYFDLGYLYMAHSYRMLGGTNYQQAILVYQEMMDICSNSPYCPVAQYYIGLTYYNMGEYQQSIDEFGELLTIYPNSEWPDDSGRLIVPCAQYYIAWCYESGLSQYNDAITAYQQVIDLYPDSTWSDGSLIPAEATFQIGQCYRKQGEQEEDMATQQELLQNAIAAYQQVIDQYPDSVWSNGNLIAEDAQSWIDWIELNYF